MDRVYQRNMRQNFDRVDLCKKPCSRCADPKDEFSEGVRAASSPPAPHELPGRARSRPRLPRLALVLSTVGLLHAPISLTFKRKF
jgi:hypothetical protein